MDLFSGSGGLSRACRRLGVPSRCWDLAAGEQYDLTKPRVLRTVIEEIRCGRVLAVALWPPCGSFGPAGNRRKAIRSAESAWGLDAAALTDREALRIQVGNDTMKAAFTVIRALQRYQVPWMLEHCVQDGPDAEMVEQ